MSTGQTTAPGVALIHEEDADLFTVVIQGRSVTALRSELESIVQAAYDQHGIIASPSYAKEAETGRAIEDAREVSDQADYLAAQDPAQTTIEEQIQEADLDALRANLTGEIR